MNIYNTTYDLGKNYLENICLNDYYINQVLDISELGKFIASDDDEYMLLSTGRVIQFYL